MSSHEKQMDKMVTEFFDRLWKSPTYLDFMGQVMKQNLTLQKQWNQNLESVWKFWQLPNQSMQQKTLHQINTLLTEWRFEQEELVERLDRIESDLATLKQEPQDQSTAKKTITKSKGGSDSK